MTYRNCKKLIELADKRGIKTEAWIEDMKNKIDVFYLNNRLTQAEYAELMEMLEPAKETEGEEETA